VTQHLLTIIKTIILQISYYLKWEERTICQNTFYIDELKGISSNQ